MSLKVLKFALPTPEKSQLTPTLFIIQAGCINVVGVASVLSGIAVPIVISVMIAQGIYLTIDAHRTIKNSIVN